MTLEAGKEMDRRCVMNWLNEVYVMPSIAFNRHTEDELRMFAYDALVLLKEQEPELVEIVDSDGGRTHWYVCGGCKTPINLGDRFCPGCGREVKWDG